LPVAQQVALALEAPLDALVVSKLGAPGQPELAVGALASGGVRVLSEELIDRLGVSDLQLDNEIDRQQGELSRRERQYRGVRPFPELAGKTIILVDDGLATGSTMEAAIEAVRSRKPAALIVAVPVAPLCVPRRLLSGVDRFVALQQPRHFKEVGPFY
jgi:putative phosphoribosyl transferase